MTSKPTSTNVPRLSSVPFVISFCKTEFKAGYYHFFLKIIITTTTDLSRSNLTEGSQRCYSPAYHLRFWHLLNKWWLCTVVVVVMMTIIMITRIIILVVEMHRRRLRGQPGHVPLNNWESPMHLSLFAPCSIFWFPTQYFWQVHVSVKMLQTRIK